MAEARSMMTPNVAIMITDRRKLNSNAVYLPNPTSYVCILRPTAGIGTNNLTSTMSTDLPKN